MRYGLRNKTSKMSVLSKSKPTANNAIQIKSHTLASILSQQVFLAVKNMTQPVMTWVYPLLRPLESIFLLANSK
jgi:hypothetical protein